MLRENATVFEMERAARIAQASEFISHGRLKVRFEERGILYWVDPKSKNVYCAWDCQQSLYLDFDDTLCPPDAKSERLVQKRSTKDLKGRLRLSSHKRLALLCMLIKF